MEFGCVVVEVLYCIVEIWKLNLIYLELNCLNFFFLALVFDVFVCVISWVSGYFGGVAEKGFIVKWNLGVVEFLYCVIEL